MSPRTPDQFPARGTSSPTAGRAGRFGDREPSGTFLALGEISTAAGVGASPRLPLTGRLPLRAAGPFSPPARPAAMLRDEDWTESFAAAMAAEEDFHPRSRLGICAAFGAVILGAIALAGAGLFALVRAVGATLHPSTLF